MANAMHVWEEHMNNQNTSDGLDRNQRLALVAASIGFLIGWYATGHGLAKYGFLGTEYGGYVLATALLLLMILSYRVAIRGTNKAGLVFYIVCAIGTFLCNLNSFYPSYRADALIRQELRTHRTKLADLRESVKSRFVDVQLDKLAADVRSKSLQVQEQVRQRGLGPRAEDDLKQIEALLGTTLTRLKYGSTQAEHDVIAMKYRELIEAALLARLKENRYLDKLDGIRNAEEYYDVFSKKVDESLSDRTDLKTVPPYVEDLIKGYGDTCQRAAALAAAENLKKPFGACDASYASPNGELGTFSHTFRSAWNTRTDGGTLAVLFVAIFIDFVFPLALYMLVRRNKAVSGARKSGIWTLGQSEMPTSAK